MPISAFQVLRDQHLGKESRSRDSFVDYMRGHWGLGQQFATTADPFAADMPLYLEDTGRIVELLAYILSDALQTTATLALRLIRLVVDFASWEGGWQSNSPRLLLRR
jgi:hypothetical protein